jgi:hypothetical protein
MKESLNAGKIAHDGYRKLSGSAIPEMGSATYDHTSGKEYERKPLGPYKDPGAGNFKEIEGYDGSPNLGQGDLRIGSSVKMYDNSTAIGKGHESKAKPVTPADVSLSRKHHEDSIQFNERHAVDHDALGAKESGKAKLYNADHAKAHRKEEQLHKKELASLRGRK